MACHEIAALRLSLMNILGQTDESEREHEIAELGPWFVEPGPLQSLAHATNLSETRQYLGASISHLQQRVAETDAQDPQLPYYRSLVIVCKKVEQELERTIHLLQQQSSDLDELHDFIHEVYP